MIISVFQGRLNNYQHTAIIELCIKIFYGSDGIMLATLYPEKFAKFFPTKALALILTAVCAFFRFNDILIVIQIACALREWEMGYFKCIEFNAKTHGEAYRNFWDHIKLTDNDDHQKEKLWRFLAYLASHQ